MEAVLIVSCVGLEECYPSLTPVLKRTAAINCSFPLRREKDNTPFRIMSKFLRICNCLATSLSFCVRKDYEESQAIPIFSPLELALFDLLRTTFARNTFRPLIADN